MTQWKNNNLLRESEKKNSNIHLSAEDKREIKRIYYMVMKYNRKPHIEDIMDKVLNHPNFEYLCGDWDGCDELTIAVARYLKNNKLPYSTSDSEGTYAFVPKYKESMTSSKRMKEGVGAGFTFSIYGIKLKNVKIRSIKKNEYDEYEAKWSAEIDSKMVDYSCDHSYWGFDSREVNTVWVGNYDYDIPTEPIIISGVVDGFSDQGDESLTKEDWIASIEEGTYDISTLYGGGYIRTPMKEDVVFESDDISAIDMSKDNECNYIVSANIKIDKDSVASINECIDIAEDPESYYEENYSEEEDF